MCGPNHCWRRAGSGVARSLRLAEEAVRGSLQAQVFAEGLALILAAEDAAALQLGHDQIHKLIEPARQIREHDVEAVGALARKPLLHLVCDGFGGADERESAEATETLRELAHRQPFALGELNGAFAAALATIRRRDFG